MRLLIVGSGRSGTTLVWRMLNAHPDVFVFRETHWLPALVERFGRRPVPVGGLLDVVGRMRFVDGSRTTPLDETWVRSLPDFRDEMTVRSFCDMLGRGHAAAVGKRYWADKTPDYGFFIADAQRLLWPELRVLHLVRDGRDAAQSMSVHAGYRALVHHGHVHWGPLGLDYELPEETLPSASLAECLDLWLNRVMRIRDEATHLSPGTYLEVKHESVLADPAASLSRIAHFARLGAPKRWLEEAVAMIKPERGGPRPRPAIEQVLEPRHRRLLGDLGYGPVQCI